MMTDDGEAARDVLMGQQGEKRARDAAIDTLLKMCVDSSPEASAQRQTLGASAHAGRLFLGRVTVSRRRFLMFKVRRALKLVSRYLF